MLRTIPIVPTIMTRTPSTTNSSKEFEITILRNMEQFYASLNDKS